MVSHARTAAQRREQRQRAEARFAGRLCKTVELRNRGFAPSHALMRGLADYKATPSSHRSAIPSACMEQTLDAPVPQVMESPEFVHLAPAPAVTRRKTPDQARRSHTCRCRCSAYLGDRTRASGTCWHLCSSSDRVCGVRACRHRHGACSSERIRGSITCFLPSEHQLQ